MSRNLLTNYRKATPQELDQYTYCGLCVHYHQHVPSLETLCSVASIRRLNERWMQERGRMPQMTFDEAESLIQNIRKDAETYKGEL